MNFCYTFSAQVINDVTLYIVAIFYIVYIIKENSVQGYKIIGLI